jgi:drug/metabolite transporter (DMT)-like permease
MEKATAAGVGYCRRVALGLITAFAAALCYGSGSVLQAIAARSTRSVSGLDPRLLATLFRSWRYVVGVALDGLGFLLSLVAVRSLPLFVVQSVVASFLAITAVLGALFLSMPLSRSDKIALAVVVAGLVMVGASAAEDSAVEVSGAERWGVLAAAVLLAVVAVPLGRLSGRAGAASLGAVAGLAFGATSVAARMLPDFSLSEPGRAAGDLLRSPPTYALAVAGAVALLAYSIALQRASVTQATAPLVVGETIAPALVGLLLLGDAPRPGAGWLAVTGFVLSVAGAVSLARHGEIRADEDADRLGGTVAPR